MGSNWSAIPSCPACGDFITNIAAAYGLDPAALGELSVNGRKELIYGARSDFKAYLSYNKEPRVAT